VRNIILACLVLTSASVPPADARSHRRAHPTKPAAQTTQADDKTAAEKASPIRTQRWTRRSRTSVEAVEARQAPRRGVAAIMRGNTGAAECSLCT
jgi:hypothetical protein